MSKSKRKIFKAVIIGAGRVGCFYDRPQDMHRCSTHAHAYYNSRSISLAGIFDINKNKAFEAAEIWKTKAYESLTGMLSEVKPDIVSITVPPKQHYRVFAEVSNYKPRLVFMEKPLADSLGDAVKIVQEAQNRSIKLVVNYQRQWMKEVADILKKYRDGGFGKFLSGTVYYNKGLRNNGAHFLQLMISLLGAVTGARVLGKRADYSREDPTLDAAIDFREGRVYFIGLNNKYYSVAEAELFFEKGRVSIRDFGRLIIESGIGQDTYYPEERILKIQRSKKTSLSLLKDVMANLIGVLQDKAEPAVSGRDALNTEKALAKIAKKVR